MKKNFSENIRNFFRYCFFFILCLGLESVACSPSIHYLFWDRFSRKFDIFTELNVVSLIFEKIEDILKSYNGQGGP